MKPSAFPTLDGLFNLACRDGVDIRPTLLRVLTDLYVQKPDHTPIEQTQYVELALGLIAAVDDATKASVAASLAGYQAAPTAVLQALGRPEQAPAEPDTKPQATTEHLTELFFRSGSEARRVILSNLDIPQPVQAQQPKAASAELVVRLEAAAMAHNTVEFGRALEQSLSIGTDLAKRIARDPLGEPIVVAAKALGMPASVFQRILLFLNPSIGQSVQRVHDLADFFEALKPEVAAKMVAIWRQQPAKSRPVYQPVHWDDERRDARSLASPSARRVTPAYTPPTRIKDRGA